MASARIHRMLTAAATPATALRGDDESAIGGALAAPSERALRDRGRDAALLGMGLGAVAWAGVQVSRVLSSDWFWNVVVPRAEEAYQYRDAIELAFNVISVADDLGIDVFDLVVFAATHASDLIELAEFAVDGLDLTEAAATFGLSLAVGWAVGKLVDSHYEKKNAELEQRLAILEAKRAHLQRLCVALSNSLPAETVRSLLRGVDETALRF